jgi:hypothetical protein
MSDIDEKRSFSVDTTDEDDRELVALGYKPSFKREFTNLATVRRRLGRYAILLASLTSFRSVLRSVSW